MSDNLNQWHSIAYFSKTIMLAKTQHKTPNIKLLAIIEALII